jgi:hypothetical protein
VSLFAATFACHGSAAPYSTVVVLPRQRNRGKWSA